MFESYRFLAWQALNCGYVGDQHRYDESYRPNGALERTEGVVKPRPCQEMLRGAFIPRNLSVGNLAHHKQLLAGKLNLRLLE